LGLSICHVYVRSHNGEIRVDSVVNHGTPQSSSSPRVVPHEILRDLWDNTLRRFE
jgi:signal transduction histidine kinase